MNARRRIVLNDCDQPYFDLWKACLSEGNIFHDGQNRAKSKVERHIDQTLQGLEVISMTTVYNPQNDKRVTICHVTSYGLSALSSCKSVSTYGA